jgi:hypothetical protein
VPPKEVVERLHAAGVLYMVSSSYLVGEPVWNLRADRRRIWSVIQRYASLDD